MSERFDGLANQVDEALSMFEWGPFGIREYQDVTSDAKSLQESLIDHLHAYADLGEYNEQEEEVMIHALIHYIEQDFACSHELSFDDEVIAHGEGLAMLVNDEGESSVIFIDKETRLHGKLERVIVVEAPVLETVLDSNDEAAEPIQPLNQMSVAFELSTASVESITSDQSNFIDPPGGIRIYLPIAYDGLRLKRLINVDDIAQS